MLPPASKFLQWMFGSISADAALLYTPVHPQAVVEGRRRFLSSVVNHSREVRNHWAKQLPLLRSQRCTGVKAWHQR